MSHFVYIMEQAHQIADKCLILHFFVPTLLMALYGSFQLYPFVFKDYRSVWFLRESAELIVYAGTIRRSSGLCQKY